MADVRLIPTVRTATAADGPLLLKWRNDPDTRAASISTDPVSPETHAAWLEGSLDSPRRILLIAELADEPVGMVRFDAVVHVSIAEFGDEPVGTVRFDAADEQVPATWLVSINLAPDARGRGLAAAVLQAGWDWLEAAVPVDAVLAEIRVSNTASIRAFERAGYRLVATGGGWHHYERKAPARHD